jgi:hypothetical protein
MVHSVLYIEEIKTHEYWNRIDNRRRIIGQEDSEVTEARAHLSFLQWIYQIEKQNMHPTISTSN